MHPSTRLRATWLGAVALTSVVVACSGAAPQGSSQQGKGPIDGEIPGAGTGAGASGSMDAGAAMPGTGTGGSGGGGGGAATGTGGSGGGGATGGSGGSGGAVPVEPGTLTAGAWDDNRNFDLFLSYRAEVEASGADGLLGFTVKEHQTSHDLSASWLTPHQLLDIALVLDTTGSMGDEMAYLKAELIAISGKIEKLHPNAEQRWSLIVYKDLTDVYVVRWFGFRDGVKVIQQKLAEQSAGGGGDFPESPDVAFQQLNKLYWRDGADVARLAFWVADAPEHPDKAKVFTDALRRTRDLGIHVYPIASSGIDEPTELVMRSAAQITGGRYLFLTDDSGVGGPHKAPSIPCYFVTKLDDAMVRMVDIEMSGKYHEPDPSQVLRTGGDPQNGACVLDSGDQVVAY